MQIIGFLNPSKRWIHVFGTINFRMNEKKKENKEKKNFFKVIWLGQVKGEMKVFSPQVYQFFFFFSK